MSDSMDLDASLVADGVFEDPLRRVAFEPGMLLGVDAMREEQDFHRRRLNRHQYWIHGYGTVAGLPVVARAEAQSNPDVHMTVRIVVQPGIAIDGLGREVILHEPYCLDLGQWLERYSDQGRHWPVEQGGYHQTDNSLWLRVSIRQRACPSRPAPVLAARVGASTDAVADTRIQEGIALQIIPDYPPPGVGDRPPWGEPAHRGSFSVAHARQPTPDEPPLTAEERDYLAALPESERSLLTLQGRLLHGLPADNGALELARDALEEIADVLLARIRITLGPERLVISNPHRIAINNLVRPFVTTSEQLAALRRAGP